MMENHPFTGCALTVAAFVFFMVILTVLGSAMGFWNLHFMRWAMPYQEETRRITFTHSTAYQQGSQTDFENLCLQLAQAKDLDTKAMIRNIIRRRANDYVGAPLSADLQSCISGAQ